MGISDLLQQTTVSIATRRQAQDIDRDGHGMATGSGHMGDAKCLLVAPN